jgi:prepilin-type N-terminal cleavage/methylation domain-containing protein
MTAQSTQFINNQRFLSDKKGFTLIELLVTIAIIAIISVVAVALFGNIQANARDGKRKAELESIANALEVNKDTTTGFYTKPVKGQFGGGVWPGQTATSGTAALDPQQFPYCILTATNGTSPTGTSVVTGWSTTPTCATTNGGSMINDGLAAFSSVNAWTICTRLEQGGGTAFCRSNVQ